MKKRISGILSCVLAAVMAVTAVPADVYASVPGLFEEGIVSDEDAYVTPDAETLFPDYGHEEGPTESEEITGVISEESAAPSMNIGEPTLGADYYVAGGSYTYKGDMSEIEDHKYKEIFSGIYNDIQVERNGGRFFTGEEIVSLSGYGDTPVYLNEITDGALGEAVEADTIAASGGKVNFEVHDIPAEFTVDRTFERYDDESNQTVRVELNDETLIRRLYAWEYEQNGTTGIYHRVSSQEITSENYSFSDPETDGNGNSTATELSGNAVVDTSKLKAGKITEDNVIAIVAYMYDAGQKDSLFKGDWEYNDDNYFYALEQVEFDSNRYFDVTEDDYYSDRTAYYKSDIYLKSEMGSFSVAPYIYRRDDSRNTLTLYNTSNQPDYGLTSGFSYGWRSKNPEDYLLDEWIIPARWTDPLTQKEYDVRLGEIGYFYDENTGEKMYTGGRRYPILASGVTISYGVGFPDDCTSLLTTGHSKLEMMCVTSLTIEGGPNGEKVGSNITDMNSMFYGNTYGNMGYNVPVTMLNSLDISALDTSNVTDMSRMFYAQYVVGSGPDVSGFDTSKVTDMSYMFYDAHISNPNVSNFNTSNVTDMAYMFGAAGVWTDFKAKPHAYAQGVYTSLDLSGFDFGKVDSMAGMFLNQKNLSSIKFPGDMDTSHVRDMSELFMSCSSLTLEGAENLTLLDTSSVVDMFGMFGCFHWISKGPGDKRVLGDEYSGYYDGYLSRGCYQSHSGGREAGERGPAFTSLDLSAFKNFDTSRVQNMALMFDLPEAEQLSFGSRFDTSKVPPMNRMFNLRKKESLNISCFNTGSLNAATRMFDLDICTDLTLGTGFDLSKINKGKSGSMFSTPVLPALDLSGVNFGDNADALSSSSIAYFNLGYMESGCYELEELRLPANMPVFSDPVALPETMYDEGGDEYDAVYGGNTEALTLIRGSDPLKNVYGFYIDGQDPDKLVSETTVYTNDQQDGKNKVYLKLKMDPETPVPAPTVSYTIKGYRDGVECPANYVATIFEGQDGIQVYAYAATLDYESYVTITANIRRSDGEIFTASCRVRVEKSQNEELTLKDSDGNTFTCYTNSDGSNTVTIKELTDKGGTQDTLTIGTLTGNGRTYTVTRIGNYAFHYTRSNVYFSTAYYPYGQSGGKVFTKVVLNESVKVIGEYAFDFSDSSGSSVTSFSGPGVEVIGDHAFNDMVAMTTVNLPSVKHLGCGVFSNTTSITSLTLNPSIESWNNGVLTDEFGEDRNLTAFTIPSCITELGERGFPRGITKLDNIPSNVTRIGYHAFADYLDLQSVTIPATVTEIGEGAFYDCEKLATVTFAENGNLTRIGDYAFMRCKSLTSISFPDTVTDFGKGVVKMINDNTSALTTVKLPKNINEVPDETFFGCDALTSATLPDNIVRIGTGAFRYTASLTSFTIPETVTKLGDGVFYESGITSIVFPEGITVIPAEVCYGCVNLTSVTFEGAVTEIGTSTEGAAAGLSFDYCTALTSINLPDTLTYLGRYSFCSCFSLEGNISIPQGVTVIDEYVFAGAKKITGITMPDAVTSIKKAAFKDCEQLTNVEFSVNTQDIGTDAFRNCKNLEIVALPVGIKNIDWYAFLNVGSDKDHAEVYLPNTVESVGYLAFQGLGGGDKAYILYGGSEEDEKKIRFTGGETSLWLSYMDDHGVSYNTGWNVTDAGVKYVPHEVKNFTGSMTQLYFVEKDEPMKDTVSVVQDYEDDIYGFDAQGYRYENTSAVIDGILYYFDEHGRGTAASSGYSAGTTGIVEISDGVFVYVKNGSVQKASPAELLPANIITVDGKKYLLTGSGVLATGFIPDDSAYTASSAEYGITGWYFDDNTAEISWVKKTDAQGNDTYYGADYTTLLTGTYPNEDGELVKYANGHCALLTGLKITDEEGTEITRTTLYKGPDSGTSGKPDTATIKLVTLPEDVAIDPVPTVIWSIINNNPKKKGETVITEASHTDGQIIVNANAPGRAKVRVSVSASVDGGASVTYTKDCLVIVEDTNVYPTSVTITADATSVKIGSTLQLEATISPANATAGTDITWSSSDVNIATTDQTGLVRGMAEGNVVITASTENGVRGTYNLAVGNAKPEPSPSPEPVSDEMDVTKVTLNKTAVSLYPGDSFKLSAAVSPAGARDKSVTWSSSDGSGTYVELDDTGLITARSADVDGSGDPIPATVTITAAANGAAAGTTVKAECIVTVLPSEI
ncbi:MAG: leucine-rich repeat protein, partial [Lachnospiraceae bacterium]|nr:leucine-rich repeat protein [Lachnospiraceae bacterium]